MYRAEPACACLTTWSRRGLVASPAPSRFQDTLRLVPSPKTLSAIFFQNVLHSSLPSAVWQSHVTKNQASASRRARTLLVNPGSPLNLIGRASRAEMTAHADGAGDMKIIHSRKWSRLRDPKTSCAPGPLCNTPYSLSPWPIALADNGLPVVSSQWRGVELMVWQRRGTRSLDWQLSAVGLFRLVARPLLAKYPAHGHDEQGPRELRCRRGERRALCE